jgi:hypothetical protein
MKTFLKVVLVVFVLYFCATVGGFFAGVIGAIVAVYLHASPYAITLTVRVLAEPSAQVAPENDCN